VPSKISFGFDLTVAGISFANRILIPAGQIQILKKNHAWAQSTISYAGLQTFASPGWDLM
jgi:hypothetical protein